jgi:hypothetical protein
VDSDTDTDADTDADSDVDTDSDTDPPLTGCDYMDILFVIDISASMMEEQDNLDANFPEFVAVLEDYVAEDDTFEEFRVGVTNMSINGVFGECETTMGFDGALFDGVGWSTDCGLEGALWIDGPTAYMAETFSCLADNPIPYGGGVDCGHEMPLEVINRFGPKLADGQPNEGFYREELNSLLVIVILTDEDEDPEYSPATPAGTKNYLDVLTGGEDRYVIVVVAGAQVGGCTSDFGSAIEAVTLKEFTGLMPNGFFGDICLGDLSISLEQALEEMIVACDEMPDIE